MLQRKEERKRKDRGREKEREGGGRIKRQEEEREGRVERKKVIEKIFEYVKEENSFYYVNLLHFIHFSLIVRKTHSVCGTVCYIYKTEPIGGVVKIIDKISGQISVGLCVSLINGRTRYNPTPRMSNNNVY